MAHPIIKAAQMNLGDVVRMKGSTECGAHCDCTVKQIKDGRVTLFRPYARSDDNSGTWGVIVLIGIEQYNIKLTSGMDWELVKVKGPLR